MDKQIKKISGAAFIYGAFFGMMPPYIFALIVIANPIINGDPTAVGLPVEGFRYIYYVRLVLGIIIGVLAGGYSAYFTSKMGVKLFMKHKNILTQLLVGLAMGAICGFLTLGLTPLMLLISSTDLSWAFAVIYRMAFVGAILGSIAGVFFSLGIRYFLEGEK